MMGTCVAVWLRVCLSQCTHAAYIDIFVVLYVCECFHTHSVIYVDMPSTASIDHQTHCAGADHVYVYVWVEQQQLIDGDGDAVRCVACRGSESYAWYGCCWCGCVDLILYVVPCGLSALHCRCYCYHVGLHC